MQIEVVDDCSTDDPQAIVDELAPTRVGFHQQPENRGHTHNFNTCIERSRGQLVHLLHGDDTVRDGFYQTLAPPFHDHPDLGAAFCRHVYVDEAGCETSVARLHEPTSGIFPDAAYRLAAGVGIQPPTVVVPRSTYERLGGFDRRLRVAGEDLEMWVRIAAHYPVWYEIEPLARYHRRPRSLISGSARSGAAIRDYRLTIDLVTEYIEPGRRASAHRAARRRCAEWALVQARALAAAGDRSAALVQLREALLSDHSPRVALRAAKTARADGRRRGRTGQTVSDRRPELPRRFAPPAEAKDRPLWSVMIPTYNCAGYLRETLASVLAQDPGPDQMQIEVVDDCSTDDPQAIVDELAPTRVSFHQQPENRGHTHNFNTCIERSRGQLVHLLHGDDTVRDGFYQTLAPPFHDHPDLGAAFCRYISMNDEGDWETIAALEPDGRGILNGWLERIALGQRLQPPTIVVRRSVYEAIGGFDPRAGLMGEDWEMWVRSPPTTQSGTSPSRSRSTECTIRRSPAPSRPSGTSASSVW